MLNQGIRYIKCPRCELNYIQEDEAVCPVCKREISGERDDFEDDLVDLCPFCEKNALTDDEEMCAACRAKMRKF